MAYVAALADHYEFAIIEDASHAIGGKYLGERAVAQTATSQCSVPPVKIITTGEDGLATTNNPELAQRMAELRSHGITKDERRFKGRHLARGAMSSSPLDSTTG